MILRKKTISSLLAIALTMSLCAFSPITPANAATRTTTYSQLDQSLAFDTTKWNYDETNNVYWRIAVQYCANPATTKYETMGIYVPGQYMTATKNSDGTYTCQINKSGEVNGYTAKTAPIILPVDTPGYIAQAAPTSYDYNSISSYIKAGYVYVIAGMRGRGAIQSTSADQGYSGGAPYGVTDLKAAVRYYRVNKSLLPGNTDKIFSYGMSGGGAQSALIGATGDSKEYDPYLKSIGAAMTDEKGNRVSDAITGSMCWCPITSLDYADEAYEWNMGQYFSTDTRDSSKFTSALSKDMATEFASYINKLGLKGEDGTLLNLSKSSSGIYNSGTYYDYIKKEIETSLNNFLSDTTFPYTAKQTSIQIGNGPSSGGGVPNLSGDVTTSSAATVSTYETPQDYINSLNTDENWINYDAATNTTTITSIEAFVKHCKNASKPVGAFDVTDLSRGENNLFGNGQSTSSHFDSVEANLLSKNASTYSKYSDWNSSYVTAFADDLKKNDSLGTNMKTRVNMYNPMYYLSNYYSGYKTSTPAKYWRIRTGLAQTDTALTVETNLKLALERYRGVKSVDFATVWAQPHTTAERTGTSTDNFISWVNTCITSEKNNN